MSFKTAQEHFETAQEVAESTGDTASESIAAGLIDLTKAIKLDIARLKTELASIKSKVK